jgi:phospholipid/cholesterol/gamma-HCH transport system substrate-binding protein
MVAIRKHMRDFVAIVALIAIAVGVSGYVLLHQRLRFPLIQAKPFEINAEFQTAQAVIAGQGQTVRVSGVRVGDIGDVKLRNGHAVVKMQIDPEYADMIHTDATALLRPKTGLKDMFVELNPGTDSAPRVHEGWTLPISRTEPDVNPDEILSELDDDTRDYLRLLISGAGKGLDGRGPDLREVFARFEPTHRDLARVNGAVAERRQNLRHLITSLSKLNTELASRDDDLAGLVDSSAAVMRAFASEQAQVSSAVRELPGTLSQTTDTLDRVGAMARILRPTAQNLRPAARSLDAANKSVLPLATEITPRLRDDIRPFVREARPLARDLRPTAQRLSSAIPDLTQDFAHINRFFNLLAFNPNGREGPDDAARQEGYLFWLAWVDHMANQLFSSSDANGTFRPVTLAASCSTLQQITKEEPQLEFLSMLTPILASSEACAN